MMDEQINFYDQLERQYHDVKSRTLNIKKELGSYEKIMQILGDHINENLNVQKVTLSNKDNDARKQIALKESYDKLSSKYERFRVAKIEREDEYKRCLNEKMRIEGHLNSMKTQVTTLKKIKDAHDTARPANSESSYDYDVETINFLNECNWNLGGSCDRQLAESLLGCFPSGTFLVRSAKKKTSSFALSVVANSKVQHCLIDKTEDGFCFHPPGPQHHTYNTLCSLVMDYRHKSLLIHHPQLDTNLIYPVLSQIKKTSNGPH